ncbi:MAG: rRNA maturation RNase YbeY [Gammaproteobacteria bacterium]
MNRKTNRPKHRIEIQRVFRSEGQPDSRKIRGWIGEALKEARQSHDCVVRIVDVDEIVELNRQYRHKSGPTNILSFPFAWPEEIAVAGDSDVKLLGDLVICAPVVEKEAAEQHKTLEHHWAHIVIHGVLHLLGYDHIRDDEAELMESKEIEILEKLHIHNPYIEVIHE